MSTPPGTVHLITVGVSLFDNLTSGITKLKEIFPHDHDLAASLHAARKHLHDPKQEKTRTREDESRRQAAWLTEVTAPEPGTARRELESLLDQIAPEHWPAQASAELSSLAAINLPGKKPTVPVQDTAILITSDTGRGMRAALFNALALAGGNLDRIRYLHDPREEDILASAHKIVIARLPGLDVEGKEDFTEAMRELGRIGRGTDRLLKGGKNAALLHLSGGFKAALPFLLALGEALRGLHSADQVRACVLHDLAPGLRTIELPLRSLPPKLIADHVANTDTHGYFTTRPPQGQHLRGFAYDLTDTHLWKLTPFGEALRELYRDRPLEEEA